MEVKISKFTNGSNAIFFLSVYALMYASYVLFLAYHVNICIVFLSIYHNKIFQPAKGWIFGIIYLPLSDTRTLMTTEDN